MSEVEISFCKEFGNELLACPNPRKWMTDGELNEYALNLFNHVSNQHYNLTKTAAKNV